MQAGTDVSYGCECDYGIDREMVGVVSSGAGWR